MLREDGFAPFRAKENRNIYQLTITLVNKDRKIVEIKENIDAYSGEVGKRYAKNLLFRMGNDVVKGTEFENIPWEEMEKSDIPREKEFGFIKSKEDGSYLLAMATWIARERKPEKIASDSPKGVTYPYMTNALKQTECTD